MNTLHDREIKEWMLMHTFCNLDRELKSIPFKSYDKMYWIVLVKLQKHSKLPVVLILVLGEAGVLTAEDWGGGGRGGGLATPPPFQTNTSSSRSFGEVGGRLMRDGEGPRLESRGREPFV